MAVSVSGAEGGTGVDRARNAPRKAPTEPTPHPIDGSWSSILERCKKVAQAHSVIAVDGEGLPVAWVGNLGRVEAARIAAHVARSFDLLDRLKYVGRLAECLCVMYWPEGTWLTAVRIAPKVSAVVTIAVVGPYTLVHRDRRRLRNTFVQLLEESWSD